MTAKNSYPIFSILLNEVEEMLTTVVYCHKDALNVCKRITDLYVPEFKKWEYLHRFTVCTDSFIQDRPVKTNEIDNLMYLK